MTDLAELSQLAARIADLAMGRVEPKPALPLKEKTDETNEGRLDAPAEGASCRATGGAGQLRADDTDDPRSVHFAVAPGLSVGAYGHVH